VKYNLNMEKKDEHRVARRMLKEEFCLPVTKTAQRLAVRGHFGGGARAARQGGETKMQTASAPCREVVLVNPCSSSPRAEHAPHVMHKLRRPSTASAESRRARAQHGVASATRQLN
jgi:hypothetical protein